MKKLISMLTIMVILLTGCKTTSVVYTEYHRDANGTLIKYTVNKKENSDLCDQEIIKESQQIIAYMLARRNYNLTHNDE